MRILVIDDHPLFREVIVQHLKDLFLPKIVTVFEAASSEEAQQISQYQEFDIILLDINLPGLDGTLLFPKLRKRYQSSLIVILSSLHAPDVAKNLIDQGANGYLSKSDGAREIDNAIKLILSGEVYISPLVLAGRDSLSMYSRSNIQKYNENFGKLTSRQQEVAKLIAEGLPNKLIASKLHCTEGTVKLHVSSILKRLNVHNRTEVALEISNVM